MIEEIKTCLNYNRITLAGRLTANPETRFTPSGTAVCDFQLAENESRTDKSGERHDDVCFITCVAWGKQAELIGSSLQKGNPVLVEGRLKFEQWEKDGQKRSRHVVRVDGFKFIESRKSGQSQSSAGNWHVQDDDEIPF